MARILFNIQYPAYLRFFGGVVSALGERGHQVLLAYDKLQASTASSSLPGEALPSVKWIGGVPSHSGPWRDLLIEVGCTLDYLRFLSPAYGGTPYLRARMAKHLPRRFAGLKKISRWPAPVMRASLTACGLVERAIPPDPALVSFLREIAPDAMVVSPLVNRGPGGVQQTQLVKAARQLGVPVALAVGSWDHLSSKGLVRVDTDQVIVWNEIQKQEAAAFHKIPSDRIVVTGAQPFDAWFGMQPSLTREAFCARVGLPPDRPLVVYVGSSWNIARGPLEVAFVRRWLEALRRSSDAAARDASVLIRPHPSNMRSWEHADAPPFPPVAVWPRSRPAIPMNPVEAADYFHSLYYSAAIVGINTSAMIEASILDRPVLTVQPDEFEATQAGTTHFHYLVPDGGGCVATARTFEAHVDQLSAAIRTPERGREARRRFVEQFVRPRGVERPAVDHVVDAIEALARLSPRPRRSSPRWLAPLRWGLSKVAAN